MGKYVEEVQLGQPIDVVSMIMDDFMYHKQFTRADWNGEIVYRNAADQYMNWYYAAGVFHMEAWKKGVFGGTASPAGIFKVELQNLLDQLKHQKPGKIGGGHIGSDPIHHASSRVSNHQAWKRDTAWQGKKYDSRQVPKQEADKCSNSIYTVLGVMSFILAISFPPLGFITALKMISLSKKSKRVKATAVGFIALIVAVLSMIIYIYNSGVLVYFSMLYK